jgi:hypothetical protein
VKTLARKLRHSIARHCIFCDGDERSVHQAGCRTCPCHVGRMTVPTVVVILVVLAIMAGGPVAGWVVVS